MDQKKSPSPSFLQPPAGLRSTALAWILLLAHPAAAQDFRTLFGNGPDSLEPLPSMQAQPIESSADSRPWPTALRSPVYCDTHTLRASATIRALRFWDDQKGIAVGDHGSRWWTADGGASWTQASSGSDCRLNDVIWVSAQRAIAVGGGIDAVTQISRGAVLVSTDSGQSWNRHSDSDLPRLTSLRVSGDGTITAQGDPDPVSGATLFESRDAGRNWQAVLEPNYANASTTVADADHSNETDSAPLTADQASAWSRITATHLAIRASCRLSDQVMVCAGDHGMILRSTDQGANWQVVSGGETNSAVLFIAADPESVPWSLVGRETMEQRLRCSIVIGLPQDFRSSTAADRRRIAAVQQAAMQIGAAAVDLCPRPVQDDSQTDWLDSLKQWVDVHQPPVLVMDAELPAEIKTHLLQHAVAGGTNKVVEYSWATRGETLLHQSALLPHSGVLAGDFRDDCRLLVSDFRLTANSRSASQWVATTTRYSGGGQTVRGDSLGAGVRLHAKHRLPPREMPASRRRLQVLQARVKQQTAIANLFPTAHRRQQPADEKQFADALRLMLDQTSRIDQFRSAWNIAQHSIGQPYQTIVWDEIATRFPGSSAASLAQLHAQTRRSSAEWNHHQTLAVGLDRSLDSLHAGDPIAAQVGAVELLNDSDAALLPQPSGHAAILSPFQPQPTPGSDTTMGVIQASATLPIPGHRSNLRSLPSNSSKPAAGELDLAWQMHPVRLIGQDAIERNEILAARRAAVAHVSAARSSDEAAPAWVAAVEPESAPLESTGTKLRTADGNPLTPENQEITADLRRVAQRDNPWSNLLRPLSPQVTRAVRIESPPRLDGQLDEPAWDTQRNPPATTADQVGMQLQVAWDDRFVYLAVRTPKQYLAAPAQSSKPPQRDADLGGSDRVALGIDIDRDLLTAMTLMFSRDGRTQDHLDGFQRWNPSWYVASNEKGSFVITELAIEQSSLGPSIRPGNSWLINAQVHAADTADHFHWMPEPESRIRVDFE
ncbi:hypothetical protein NHH03_01335 [Stieleria sp. TO1_6]|uniref:hypothetical protein n=1 Tax=Stieleria tagensis TaxID=2956795 RepID=UPI00209B30FD|nr:hypothetical protein [Stieleria tagensis]MCO8120361.1 hypothetical protein [Stieleria tagensis]